MARHTDPTAEQIEGWKAWLAERPEVIRKMAERLDPWTLYKMKSTGHRVTIHSFSENRTVTVAVLGEFNLLSMERAVFGISPDDLEECDLPKPDEPVGVFFTEKEQWQYVNMRRKENGVAPVTFKQFKNREFG